MHRWLLVLAACGPSSIPIRMTPQHELVGRDTFDLGACRPTKRIVVTDSQGKPVEKAKVVIRQADVSNCPSMGRNITVYSSLPVETDKRGVAMICDPLAFYPDDGTGYCPHHREGVFVLVVAPAGAAKISAPVLPTKNPFAGDLEAVLGPCTALRAADPTLPCL